MRTALAFDPRFACVLVLLVVSVHRVNLSSVALRSTPSHSRELARSPPRPVLVRSRRAPGGLLRRDAASQPGLELEAYDELPEDDLEEEYTEINVTAEKSKYLGSPCDDACNPSLQHVHCHPQSKICECEKLYPVQLGPTRGCAKPKKLGEQCLYQATCLYTDLHSTCTQIKHNAVCECETGYHRSAFSRHKKQFCAADLVLISTDLPTLITVACGIAIFTGLICFVLKLFSQARYTRPRHYANAGHPPPMLYSAETGIPLTAGRPSSRSSQRSSSGLGTGATAKLMGYGAAGARKSSILHQQQDPCNSSRVPLVPASRAGAARAAAILLISCHRQASAGLTLPASAAPAAHALNNIAEATSDGLGSRRPSVASIHSSTSSAKSYSARRFERERNDKEQRLILAEFKREQQQQLQQPAPSPSPRTPHSTDELLPSVEEATETFYNEQVPTTSRRAETTNAGAEDRVDTPLFEGDAKPGYTNYGSS
ncbi:uncharacterized protein LOC106638005 [Copidosoma floridanum]|uniref:uncharacterized protein LOC106638005 n=1 Tax=Copidosoma floridanum TaxID=29053 RepID=UPI0006C99258|nr:uncharacterized protein LOC106638005 [Copidosoma floridanum]